MNDLTQDEISVLKRLLESPCETKVFKREYDTLWSFWILRRLMSLGLVRVVFFRQLWRTEGSSITVHLLHAGRMWLLENIMPQTSPEAPTR